MLSIEEALDKIRASIKPLASEEIFISDALGRVLAEDVTATLSHPPQAVSAMDGYAVRASDVAEVPATLTQIGEAAAGPSVRRYCRTWSMYSNIYRWCVTRRCR